MSAKQHGRLYFGTADRQSYIGTDPTNVNSMTITFQGNDVFSADQTGAAMYVDAGATVTLSKAVHSGRTINLNQATGSVVTLPAATGSHARFRFLVTATVTSNSHQILCAGTDEYAGTILQTDTDTADALASYPALAADNFDDIDLNGGTTGGLIGDWIEIEDIATGVWHVVGHINATGTVATPFSAT